MSGWEKHWAEGHTPWDAGREAPSLRHLMEERASPAQGKAKALVPGCGAGYDAFYLAESGYETIGLDIAPSAFPRFEQLRRERKLAHSQARMLTGDFFTASVEELCAPYDLIWDYTFFCAIDREMRPAWKRRMFELLNEDGLLAMLLFPVDPERADDQGPPYPLNPEQVIDELSPAFELVNLRQATDSHAEREGKEWLALFNKRW